jgi:hypothetical protein
MMKNSHPPYMTPLSGSPTDGSLLLLTDLREGYQGYLPLVGYSSPVPRAETFEGKAPWVEPA